MLILILLAAVLIVGCTPTPPATTPEGASTSSGQPPKTSDFLTYEDTTYKIKIDYPRDWKQTENEQTVVAFVSPKTSEDDMFSENLNLIMNDLSGQGLTLDTYTEVVKEQLLKTYDGIIMEESGTATLAGQPAYKVVYTVPSEKTTLKIMQVWIIKDDVSYVITFVADEEAYTDYMGTVQKMLNSFEITGSLTAEEPTTQSSSTKTGEQTQTESQKQQLTATDARFAGNWRIFSERIFYDIGGAGALGTNSGRNLEIKEDGSWNFGDSKGTWSVTPITDQDWKRWDVNSYGPTKKITFTGWNKAAADGPVEEDGGRIDFIWVIYHVEPPLVENAGTVWLKFGK